MDQLLGILGQSLSTFNNALLQLAIQQQKEQENQHKMEIQNGKIVEPYHKQDSSELQTNQSHFDFFDSLPDNVYTQNLDQKISNIKMNSVSMRRKDQLFKRHKREQQQKLVQRRKQLQQKFPFNVNQLKYQGQFWIKKNEKNQIFAFKTQDFEKLKPQTDLNDTIIDNYLKFMQITILPQQIANKTFIFSTFFMSKLLGDQLRDELLPDRQTQNAVQKIKKKVVETYPIMKRWTKKIDLFSKEYLVIPINAYKHWNSMIIVSPSALLTQVGQYSMSEKKSIFPEAIKTFLQLELQDRKKINVCLQNIVQTYQLLVPRQTNTHDCGLYTLCYIEHMLKNHEILDQNMQIIRNREQLKIFPRSLIFTMRQALRQLFRNLITYENKEQALKEYLNFKAQVEKISSQLDYDHINERQFKKYYRLNSHLLEDKKKKQSQIEYQCKVKFYLDCQVNHYQKDSNC